jgi:hypothetical protein
MTIEELEAENGRLRAALAKSKDPCPYCSLPAEDMAKCRSGFPGCGRADDMLGCSEFAAMLELHARTEAEGPLKEALTVLARAHTNDDPHLGFHILLGAGPLHQERRAYIEAWRTVRTFLGMSTEPAEGWDGGER